MRDDSCLDVRRFGAVGDGATDDTAAMIRLCLLTKTFDASGYWRRD